MEPSAPCFPESGTYSEPTGFVGQGFTPSAPEVSWTDPTASALTRGVTPATLEEKSRVEEDLTRKG
jgi:hypothetical protein